MNIFMGLRGTRLARLTRTLCGVASGWLLTAMVQAAPPAQTPPELPAETLTVTSLAQAPTSRVYVADIAISHIADGRIRVFEATQGRFLGMVSTGFAGNFTLSTKSDELYVATTYYSRGTRGERTDVLEVHDTVHLAPKYEVILPPRHAQALNYRGLVRVTGSGRFVLVQNATPATSITVVDLSARQVVNEVPTPGCWGTLPAASGHRFSMLCGDGKVATVTLNDQGQVTDRQVSAKLFDADTDAWFHHAEQVGDRYWFVSFLVSADRARFRRAGGPRGAPTVAGQRRRPQGGLASGGLPKFCGGRERALVGGGHAPQGRRGFAQKPRRPTVGV